MELSADNQILAILAAANPKGAIFDAESWGFTLSQTIGNSLFQPARDGELACSGQTDWGGRDLCVVDQGLPGGCPAVFRPETAVLRSGSGPRPTSPALAMSPVPPAPIDCAEPGGTGGGSLCASLSGVGA